ncbi:MscL family protein, partial [Halomonas marinisediminis]
IREAILNEDGEVIKQSLALEYGALIEAFIDFLIVGVTVFLVVKAMNRLRKKAHDEKDKTVATPKDIELLAKLTELMEEQNKLMKNSKN